MDVAEGNRSDGPLAVIGLSDVMVEEDAVWTDLAIATDATGKVTWTHSGADTGLLSVDAATGAVSLPPQDFEVPKNAELDNVYKVTVTNVEDTARCSNSFG